jgi:hypothetical protein
MENIAIIGSGTMGNGIAQVFATAGYQVKLIDISNSALTQAEFNIHKNLDRLISKGKLSNAKGPCDLCNDPSVDCEYHDEDYGLPFIWEKPALLCLCRHCHRYKLHKRFNNPTNWNIFIAHVRRGGYAADLKNKDVIKELKLYKIALEKGNNANLKSMRNYYLANGLIICG